MLVRNGPQRMRIQCTNLDRFRRPFETRHPSELLLWEFHDYPDGRAVGRQLGEGLIPGSKSSSKTRSKCRRDRDEACAEEGVAKIATQVNANL